MQGNESNESATIAEVFPDAIDVGRTHVDSDLRDRLGMAVMRQQFLRQIGGFNHIISVVVPRLHRADCRVE